MRCLAVPGAVAVATALTCAGAPALGQAAPMSCRVSAGDTRWLAESYRETRTYGLGDPEEWIGAYGGLASAGDSVFLFDQLRPGIVHLSGQMKERQTFGRAGRGPGEFDYAIPQSWVDDNAEGHMAFDGRQVVVYDRVDLASFDTEGKFRWSARLGHFSLADGVRFVGSVDEDEMIFGVDSLDAVGRRLQLWRVRRHDPSRRDLLWVRSVPRRATDDRYLTLGKREARSYWARHENCVVVSNGGSPLLWIIELSTLETDSIPLPEWQVPRFGELPTDRHVLTFGGRDLGPEPREPALLWRWSGLIVDPDGHAWLRGWSESRADSQVFIVSLDSGETRHVNLPGFPTAFGPPGVFYTARQNPDTDEQYIVRLEGRPR